MPTLDGCVKAAQNTGNWVDAQSVGKYLHLQIGERLLNDCIRMYVAAKKSNPDADIRRHFVHLHQFPQVEAASAVRSSNETERAALIREEILMLRSDPQQVRRHPPKRAERRT